MKRAALALILVLPGAVVRAQESAYHSLLGMARSAASDRGPDAGEIPPDIPRRPAARRAEAQPVVVFPARSASVWTKLFSALTPSWRAPVLPSRPEVGASMNGSVRVPFPMTVTVSSAAVTGELRGLAEYLALAVAPKASLLLRVR